MSKINDVLELTLKRTINQKNPTDYGDPVLNEISGQAAGALTAAQSAILTSANATKPFYGGYQITAQSAMLKNEVATICVGTNDTIWSTETGTSCTWTVPAGASVAQFQLWGAGGNGTSCDGGGCCSFTSSGGNGEYTYVIMSVTPGDVYCMCAGGGIATTKHNCYSTCACSGCNSFICGSNNTCIVSCGGTRGYTVFCDGCTYPDVMHPYASKQAGVQMQTNYDQCSGIHFGNPGYRYAGSCTGCINTDNTLFAQNKIPSVTWGTKACGQSICYMCQWVPWVAPDHAVCMISCGYQGYDYSGCCAANNFTIHRKPGIGGPGANKSCYSSGPTYGGCANSGSVILKYK